MQKNRQSRKKKHLFHTLDLQVEGESKELGMGKNETSWGKMGQRDEVGIREDIEPRRSGLQPWPKFLYEQYLNWVIDQESNDEGETGNGQYCSQRDGDNSGKSQDGHKEY